MQAHIVPNRRITVNFAPGGFRKSGIGLDLPLALGILAASGAIPAEAAGMGSSAWAPARSRSAAGTGACASSRLRFPTPPRSGEAGRPSCGPGPTNGNLRSDG